MLKGYEGWSFRDRSFVMALGLSILWHAFWFFSLTISVNPNKKSVENKTRVVSLGPVLDDKIFRTLIENKPELSKTFYRRLSDFSSPVEIQTKTIERYAPGSVVSLPFGRKSWNQVKGLIGGSKASPEHEFTSKINVGFADETPETEDGPNNASSGNGAPRARPRYLYDSPSPAYGGLRRNPSFSEDPEGRNPAEAKTYSSTPTAGSSAKADKT